MSTFATQPSEDCPITLSTFVDLLRLHAQKRPEKIAYRFLKDGEVEERRLTYRDLDLAARNVAALLQRHSRTGDRVLLLFPPGLDFIIALCGCFYAGRVAVPAYPPRPNRSFGRLLAIVQDAAPALALTTEEVQSRVLHRVMSEPAFQGLTVLRTDSELEDAGDRWDEISVDPGMLALLQYTSGSTSTPKGVQITHANLMHNEELIQTAFGQTEQDIIVGWLPVYHDMGLIGTVLQPLYSGAESVLMPPVSFLQNPLRWLAAISRYGATTSGGPNFAYELCCSRITPEQKADLDLSTWRVAFNGAEPVRRQTLERFATSFYDCGFRASAFAPCYGLAEATLFVSGGRTIDGPVVQSVQATALEQNRVVPALLEDVGCRTLVGCGQAPAGHKIAIVDPERSMRCEPGAVGEIWLSGPSIGTGYWNRKEETVATFQARLADTDEGPFLRTGDLGFVLDGHVFITGRRKDLVIIRGRNHYPQDLEATAEQCHPSLRACSGAAFSVEAEGEERLVIVHEVNRRGGADDDALIAAIRQAIAEEHELQVYAIVLVRPGEVPKTSSGKVQRFLCRQAFLDRSLKVICEWQAASAEQASVAEPGSDAEAQDWQEWLIQQIANRLRIAPGAIEADQPPSRYGLDSLAAVELAHDLERTAGAAVPLADLLSGLTIAELAAGICRQAESAGAAVAVVPRRHEAAAYPLSHGQRALFFLYQLDRRNSAYHIHQALRIAQAIDPDALARAFVVLVQRHPAMRTVFRMRDGGPAQEVLPPGSGPALEQRWCDDTRERLLEQMAAEARRPFDLESGPPVRFVLFRKSPAENYLLFVIHHIVSDFWSLSLFMNELAALYESELTNVVPLLPRPELEYGDYVYWQADLLAGPEGERQWAYWREELGGELPVLHLPADHPRPAVQTFRGAACHFRLDAGLRRRLRTLAVENGATLYAVLLSGWLALLHRYSGQSEVVVGSPAAGRTHAAFRSVAGYFVNPVAIRAGFAGDPVFSNFLARIRGKVLAAVAHQDFPFPLLVEKLQPQRDPSRSPVFQVWFVMQGELGGSSLGLFALDEPGAILETRALTLESVSLGEEVAQFDVAAQVCETEEDIAVRFQYNTDLFDHETIARMAVHFRNLLEGATGPALRLSELPLLSAEERRALESWNLTEVSYPPAQCLHRVIEAQVERTPDAVAVWYEGRSLTYAGLNRKANQIAHRLRSLGVGPESLVGVCMERSFALVASLLGVMKAGAAYVPFDPSYPAERLKFLVQDSDVPVLLAQAPSSGQLSSHRTLMLPIDAECSLVGNESESNPGIPVSLDNLAYVIYTSGSTGNPKGAMNSHRAIYNRLQWMQATYQLRPDDRILQKTPFSFDVSVWEFFWPLMTGASLVLARPDGHRDTRYLRDLIRERNITTAHFVPSMLAAFLDEQGIESCVSLRRVIASGEALPYALVRRFFSRLEAELHNLYGPTEAAVDVTSFACSRHEKRTAIPIGRPIANVQVYVLDLHLELSPIGVVGELYIGGVGVGRGYHRRPDLTAERFLPDPFSSQPGARMYKTGDTVRYLPDRNIEFLGRNDHQVKIRGFRIELGEIEAALERHPSVSQAVVVARQTSVPARKPANYRVAHDRREVTASEFRGFLKQEAGWGMEQQAPSVVRLAAYLVCAGQPAAGVHELRQFLKESLPDYMVPADFVFLPAFPLSPNGKLDRRALPEPDANLRSTETDYAAPETATETALSEIWSEVLGTPRIGVHDNFFELGGDSLRSLQVRARALERGLTFTLQDMMRYQTVRELAQQVATLSSPEKRQSLQPFALVTEQDRRRMPEDAEDAYPLSQIQAGLIYHLQYDPNSAVYHDIFFYQVRAPLEFDLFHQAAQESVDRHPILRTSFHVSDFSEPLQVVHRHAEVRLEQFDWRRLSPAEQQKSIQEWIETEKHRPLQLTDTSLIRLFVHQLEDDVFQIVSSYYDILLDGWSEALLVTGLLTRYSALLKDRLSPPLPALSMRYRDFVALERAAMASEESKAYWEKALYESAVYPLPRWSGRTAMDATQIRSLDIELPAGVLQGLDALARLAGTAAKHVLLAGHLKVMSLLAGHTDILIGFQTYGRPEESDADQVLGMHNTTLPFRMQLGGRTWIELVRQAFETERDLLPHRRYPLVELQKSRGRQQLFETVFNYTHFHVFQRLAALSDIEILGSWGLERSHYTLRAEFNRNPFTGQVQFDLNCDVSQICREQMQQIGGYYSRVFRAMAEQPFARHDAENLLSPAEMEIFARWNNTGGGPSEAEGLCARFEQQVQLTPDAMAVESEHGSLRYRELNSRANRLARTLRRRGIGPQALAGICMPRSVSMIVSLLAIIKTGAACVPLDPSYPAEHLALMLEETGVPVILTDRSLVDHLPPNGAAVLFAGEDDSEAVQESGENFIQTAGDDDLVCVRYTLGPGGRPVGAALPYRSLENLVRWQLRHETLSGARRTLQFAPLNFDVVFQEIFATLCSGGSLVLAAEALRHDAAGLLRYLASQSIERLYLPWVLLQQIAQAVSQGVDAPSCLREVITGGERVEITPPVADFFRALPGCLLHCQYALSGTNVAATRTFSGPPEKWETLPAIGSPIANTQAYIVDAMAFPAPVGVAGELLIGGSGVAIGYLHRPELTAERFIPDPFGNQAGARLYRTGDLARQNSEGQIYVLGRIDHQAKICGFCVELGEIEAALAESALVQQCAVVARQDSSGSMRLIAYVEPRPGETISAADLRTILKKRLPEYMLPAAIVLLERMPLTPGGRINREALLIAPDVVEERLPMEAGIEQSSSPDQAILTPIEELVRSMWGQVLSRERVDPDDNFFESGGDSLLATQLMLYLRARLKIDLPLRVLFEEAPTLGAFARKVEERIRAGASLSRTPIERVSRDEAPPLSFAQRGLWFLEHLDPGVYNTPAAVRITGRLDRPALERSLNEIVRRHETLRTTFVVIDREPTQRIAASLQLEIPLVDLLSSPPREKDAELQSFIRTEVRRPFDLEAGPLLRAFLIRMDEEDHVLFIILHHIISDGWSVGVFISEMVPLYEAFLAGRPSPLPELTVQYADFAAWQRTWLQKSLLDQQIAYWSNRLRGPLPNQDLPGDFIRPEAMRGDGGLVAASLSSELVQKLRLLGNREGCTMFMTLLGAFYVLLHYQVRREDLVVGTDLANRAAVETERLIGFFVNQVVLRMDLSGNPAFSETLGRVRTVALEAYLHQDVPFDRVVEAVNPPRERNRTPLFQVKFVLQNAPRPKLEAAGLHLSELELNSGAAKFDLLVNVWQQDGILRMWWEYSTEIFQESTMRRMAECFVALLENVAASPEQRLQESVAFLQQAELRIRQSEDQKRHSTLREKLIQKSRKATHV